MKTLIITATLLISACSTVSVIDTSTEQGELPHVSCLVRVSDGFVGEFSYVSSNCDIKIVNDGSE